MKNDYKKLAQKIHRANFFMGGQGHFDLSTKEIERLLKVLFEKDLKDLRELYRQLHNSNMNDEGFWHKDSFYGGKKEDYDY